MKLLSSIALFTLVRADFQWKPGCFASKKPREHRKESCHRIEQNDISRRQAERRIWDLFTIDVLSRVPEEKTWHCPMESVDERATGEFIEQRVHSAVGHRTRWVVHNEASTAAVLSWLNHEGIEVSARDAKTSPPEQDGDNWPFGAILPPGRFAVVEAYQGHTFYARELKDEGGVPSSGRILLKHRAGLIYVRNELNAPCPQDLIDKNPAHKEPKKKPASTGTNKKPKGAPTPPDSSTPRKVKTTAGAPQAKVKPDEHRVPKTASGHKSINKGEPKKPPVEKPEPKEPAFDAEPDCNWVHKTFINKVECAVDVFFATGSTAETTPCIYDTATSPPQCERFTMHLGTDYNSTNYLEDWSSPIKSHETYNSHRFVARMRHNNAIVQEISIDHDIIGDCPEGKKQIELIRDSGEPIQAELSDPIVPDQFRYIFNSTRQLEAVNESTHETVLIGKSPTSPKICYTFVS